MTECTQSNLPFAPHFSRSVVASFDGGQITSDGGGLLLRQVDARLGLLKRLAACFDDRRNPLFVEHSVEQMLAQRVYGLALGYEDLNDHDEWREDPLLQLLAGKREVGSEPLAGKSTLNRLELSTEKADRYKKISYRAESIDELFVATFIEAEGQAPESVVLDLDVTDLPLHGHQEGRFFHGYYDSYCYLPLYIFCGEYLLCARLRTADQDAAAGSRDEVERIVGQLRQAWPEVRIMVRADSGFCRDELMSWCEQNGVDYVIGFARNERLRKLIEPEMRTAALLEAETGRPARIFTEFLYRTTTGRWSRAGRVVAKAEHLADKENPRFVVTSLRADEWPAQPLYEELYCARGEMENRIKEQLSLFADRVSTEHLRSNQLRLYLSAMAYLLLHGLRRLGLRGTAWARAQGGTIRLRLLKIGALVRVSARRVAIALASGYAWKELFMRVWANLRC